MCYTPSIRLKIRVMRKLPNYSLDAWNNACCPLTIPKKWIYFKNTSNRRKTKKSRFSIIIRVQSNETFGMECNHFITTMYIIRKILSTARIYAQTMQSDKTRSQNAAYGYRARENQIVGIVDLATPVISIVLHLLYL